MMRPYKILHLDDSPILREVVGERCRAQGHVYIGMEGWAEVMGQLKSHPDADIFLIDLQIDGLDGERVIETVRRYHLSPPPLILLSSKDPAELERVVKQCGADGFIHKSDIKREYLFERIDRYVAKKPSR